MMPVDSSTGDADLRLSFVIPALNEAQHIGDVIEAIREFSPAKRLLDIIVVDNGSTDATKAIAQQHRATVVEAQNVTVAELRNRGAQLANGSVLVFVDGDVLLTSQWQTHIESTLALLLEQPMTVTGSRCGLGRVPSWIERYWFAPMLDAAPRYINSGHLITTRKLFDAIGGFDRRLQTGEDSDFSARAREAGAAVVNEPRLW